MTSPSAFVIRMYLPEGLPEGIRIVEKSNWVGQAVVCPQSRFAVIRERQEAERAGIYVLLGQEDRNDLPMAYIGEADPLIERLLQHYSNKDRWTAEAGSTSFAPKNKTVVAGLDDQLARNQSSSGDPAG
jgi:hypothetical protein